MKKENKYNKLSNKQLLELYDKSHISFFGQTLEIILTVCSVGLLLLPFGTSIKVLISSIIIAKLAFDTYEITSIFLKHFKSFKELIKRGYSEERIYEEIEKIKMEDIVVNEEYIEEIPNNDEKEIFSEMYEIKEKADRKTNDKNQKR